MNTIKSAIVIATLLGIGYGVHVVLNKPIPNGNMDTAAELDAWGLPRIEKLSQPDATSALAEAQNGAQEAAPGIPRNAPNNEAGFQDSVQGTVNNAAPGLSGPVPDASNTTLAQPTFNTPQDEFVAPLGSQAEQANFQSPPADDVAVGNNFPAPHPGIGGQTLPTLESNQNEAAASSPQTNNLDTLPDYPATNNAAAVPPPNPRFANSAAQEPAMPPLSPAENNQAFQQFWTSAQASLRAGNYADALITLTLWYSDPHLTDPQREQVIPLLDQLAGTVIYSKDHILEAAYVVQPGDTLEQIAAEYKISTAFLKRANSLTGPIAPGQQLKVVRGPFRGELNLKHREITLFLGRSYAGRFSAGIGRDLPPGGMSFEVTELAGARPYVDPRTNQPISPGDPRNPYGQHWIGMQVPGMPHNATMGLHSHGQEVDASDTRGCISLAGQDAEDIQSILTVGSKFTVLR